MIARAVPADEGIARRLAALKMLSTTTAVSAALPAETPSADTHCGKQRAAWWRLTRYGVRSRIDSAVRDASLLYRTDRRLIESVIRVESNYDVDAVSHKGAMGLMQLMPGTARDLGVICASSRARTCSRARATCASCATASAAGRVRSPATTRARTPRRIRSHSRHHAALCKNVMRRWKPGARASLATR